MRASVYVPATIGNVGPGFDCFGLCIGSLGDTVTVELINGPSEVADVEGVDADALPREAKKNCAIVAAESLLRRLGDTRGVSISFKKSIPVSGGLGSSAAASVGGAMAALLASEKKADLRFVATAALDGEQFVAGRHLDNIAPCLAGGLTIVRDTAALDFTKLKTCPDWWITVVTPAGRLDTKTARSVLPGQVSRDLMVAQMAHASSLVMAFANSDPDLVRRALNDLYAEPHRSPLLPGFGAAKKAALAAGALGASISGAGPTMFAISESRPVAEAVMKSIAEAYGTTSLMHVGRISQDGARQVDS
jgi:homoserine kinase